MRILFSTACVAALSFLSVRGVFPLPVTFQKVAYIASIAEPALNSTAAVARPNTPAVPFLIGLEIQLIGPPTKRAFLPLFKRAELNKLGFVTAAGNAPNR